MADYYIPEGTTEEQVYQLVADGANISGSGLNIAAEVTDKRGRAVTLSGTVGWKDQGGGKTRWLPGIGNFGLSHAESPYQVRWALTDADGRIAKVPNGPDPDRWFIVKP